MTLTELVTSPAYKKFMGYVYGFGAAVAIIGALFKILHLPGASVMLVAGLGVEAIIFALSSFEPPHETPDWTLVFPELAGLEPVDRPSRGSNNGGGSELTALVQAGAIDQNTVNKLADGVKNLAASASQMSDLADASVATKSYLNSVKGAADTLNQFSAAQSNVAEAGSKFASQMSAEGGKFAESVSKLNGSFAQQTDAAAKLGTNMTAISEAYAAQLKGINSQLDASKAAAAGLSTISSEINASVEGVKAYREQIASLSKTVSELNNIYGNMLSAIRK